MKPIKPTSNIENVFIFWFLSRKNGLTVKWYSLRDICQLQMTALEKWNEKKEEEIYFDSINYDWHFLKKKKAEIVKLFSVSSVSWINDFFSKWCQHI